MLDKVRILAFKDKELHSKSGDYTLQINPETYAHNSQTWYACATGADTAGSMQKFRSYRPETLSFEFYLDATGPIPGVKDVAKEIKALRDVVYDYHGAIHGPYYLKVLWGKLAFKCVLNSLNVTYELFDPSGKPLRAKLNIDFKQHETTQDLARRGDKKSADLTHAELVIDGDTLPLLSERVYRRPDLYFNIARANDLNDIMSLDPGTQLHLPPARD